MGTRSRHDTAQAALVRRRGLGDGGKVSLLQHPYCFTIVAPRWMRRVCCLRSSQPRRAEPGVSAAVACVVVLQRARRGARDECVTQADFRQCRGSKFLNAWMEFLEENADLRYPNPADLQEDA